MTHSSARNRISEIERPSPDFGRSFLPVDFKVTTWEEAEPYFTQLVNRTPKSAGELEQKLLDIFEATVVLEEEGTRRYIAMSCDTDDENKKNSYLEFIEKFVPPLKMVHNQLDKDFVDNPHLSELDQVRYEVLIRDVKNQIEIFCEENVPLDTELTKLAQQYQGLQGAVTVNFQGKERTLQEMGLFLEEPDRTVRRESWELTAGRRLEDAEKLNNLFDEMIKIRQQVAKNSGFDNFIGYKFKQLGRFDYTPADCLKFHEAVEFSVMPAYNRLLARRKSQLGLETLRPFDLAVDPAGRPPLKPFAEADELSDGCLKIFNQVSPELAADFEKMINLGLLDLASRKGKAPGGYQATLDEVRLPFIFMNAVGLNRDVFTLLHEGGHAFHAFATRPEPLLPYQHVPMEFAEVASMGMELIASRFLSEFYSSKDSARAQKSNLETLLFLLPWIATIDAFQHWIYSNPGHSVKDREEYWLELNNRFGGNVDHSGLDDELRNSWQKQLHLFQVPFYYIEYGIAQLGALQLWLNAKKDFEKTVKEYRQGLSLGGSRPLPELFTKAGIKFDFTQNTLSPIIEAIEQEITELGKLEN